MQKLFIDDEREPVTTDFAIVRSYDDAVAYMQSRGCPEFISFDHDLGEVNTKTGYDIAKWMVERDMDTEGYFIPRGFTYYVHSQNPVGAANINGLLENYLQQRGIMNEHF